MNRRQILLLIFVIILLILPALSQENNTIDLALSDIEFNETTSKIVVHANFYGNISNTTINEVEVDLRFQGFYFDEFNETLTATLNESMEYSMDIPKNVYGKVDITARISPQGNKNYITIRDDDRHITIDIWNENIAQEKKLLKQFVFIANVGIIVLILTGMLLVLVRKDRI
jgi:hypothetical protein